MDDKIKRAARSQSADLLKAISIFGVVFIHGAFKFPLRPPIWIGSNHYCDFVYRFL